MTTVDIGEAMTVGIFELVTGIVNEIEPDVHVSSSIKGKTGICYYPHIHFHNKDFIALLDGPTGYPLDSRPWAVSVTVDVEAEEVHVGRMYTQEGVITIELADPDSFDQIKTALRRWCRPPREDGQAWREDVFPLPPLSVTLNR